MQHEYYSARFLHATKACLKARSSAQSHNSKIYCTNWCGLWGKPGDEIMSVHTYTIETRAGHSPYRLRIFTDRKSLSKRSVLALCAPPCQKYIFFCIHINKVGQGPLSYIVTGENVFADRVRVAGRKSYIIASPKKSSNLTSHQFNLVRACLINSYHNL